jgi:hypothetical protein
LIQLCWLKTQKIFSSLNRERRVGLPRAFFRPHVTLTNTITQLSRHWRTSRSNASLHPRQNCIANEPGASSVSAGSAWAISFRKRRLVGVASQCPTNDHRGVEKPSLASATHCTFSDSAHPRSLAPASPVGARPRSQSRNKKAPRSRGLIQIKGFYWACLGCFVGFPT